MYAFYSTLHQKDSAVIRTTGSFFTIISLPLPRTDGQTYGLGCCVLVLLFASFVFV